MFGILFMLGDCSNKQFLFNYEKVKIGDEGINGYTLDLRIYANWKNLGFLVNLMH